MDDERFEPVLGRMRARPSRAGKRYIGQVIAAAGLAYRKGRGKGGATLGRIGRGSAASAFLARRGHQRRAIVKTRLVRLQGKGIGAARAHLHYIQRDGFQRDGSPGRLYSAHEDEADGRAFIEACGEDRHQFRIILSAEDGERYEDLKPLVRRFMETMENDLGSRLQWVAADHLDTGHPHSHVILRGKDELGANLVIARDYIAHGMRSRLSELVSLDLGPRTRLEVEQQMRLDVDAERLTPLDRSLARSVEGDGRLVPGGRTMAEHSIRLSRLGKLEALGLAERLDGGRWRLGDGLEDALRTLGERGDIIRTLQRAMNRTRLERAGSDLQAYQPGDGRLIGRLVERGLSDELTDKHYLILDAVDGRAYHVLAGDGSSLETLPAGAILSVETGPLGSPARVGLLSAFPVETLSGHDGATWLDAELDRPEPLAPRDAGFGREVRSAMALRRAWLLGQGLGFGEGDSFALVPGALDLLRQRGLRSAGERLAAETGLAFSEPLPGERIEGICRRRLDLPSGRFAMIEQGRAFMLVPWKPALERHLDRPVAGLMRQGRIEWLMGRERGLQR